MPTCHACQHELNPAAILEGKCPQCGALLRKLSQRTIDSKGLRESNGKSPETVVVDEGLSARLHDPGLKDTDQAGATIEVNDLEVIIDDDGPAPDDDATPLEE